jgi:hypothetical protein
MAVWPVSLPQSFELGVQDTRQQGFIRSTTDTGPYKQRKRFTATSRFLSGSMLLTGTQRATFETFYTTTISEGSDAFDFTDPSTFATISARFVQPPALSGVAGGATSTTLQFRIDLLLEVLP